MPQRAGRSCLSGILLWTGIAMIAVGLLLNERTMVLLFSRDGILSFQNKMLMRVFNVFCVGTGVVFVLIRHNRRMLVNLTIMALVSAAGLYAVEKALWHYFWYCKPYLHKPDEIALFMPNPHRTGSFRLIPNYRGAQHDMVFSVNSRGMPWREVAVEKPAGVKRVVFLGDSFTFGVSADRVENSFVGVFDKEVSHPRFETLNYGVGGYGLDDMYLLLKEEALALKPDYVFVMVFNGNDFRDTYLGLKKYKIISGTCAWNMELLRRKIPVVNREEYQLVKKTLGLQEDSLRARLAYYVFGSQFYRGAARIARMLQRNPDGAKLSSTENKGAAVPAGAGNPGAEELPDSEFKPGDEFVVSANFTSYVLWSQKQYPPVAVKARDISLGVLKDILKLCRAHGAQLVIVSIPYQEQVYAAHEEGAAYDIHFPQRYVEEFAARNNVPYLDLLPYLRGYVRETGHHIYRWFHFDNEGHKIVGIALADFFKTHVYGGGH